MALLHPDRTLEQLALLEVYAAEFDWYCFCLVCGHAPGRGQDTLQSLYQAQARRRGNRMRELYPLVCAHWDAVNLANQMAQARDDWTRARLHSRLREAKVRHRTVVQSLRGAWAGT
ncbi:hypothetical protein [Ramlibacter humi]|uniref:Uncharacterized protein n=1 Tax=Ramlibacter humi TaxID=2530451 RepID=A0A4Z0CCC8_9BURK|nr:hypothetical protein [Ramlibacter humi]TFZ07865.1 hypothetical protein EZ216_01490 [Ramlibacter humi]